MKKSLVKVLVVVLAALVLGACAHKYTDAECTAAHQLSQAGFDAGMGTEAVYQESFDAHMAWLKAVRVDADCTIQGWRP